MVAMRDPLLVKFPLSGCSCCHQNHHVLVAASAVLFAISLCGTSSASVVASDQSPMALSSKVLMDKLPNTRTVGSLPRNPNVARPSSRDQSSKSENELSAYGVDDADSPEVRRKRSSASQSFISSTHGVPIDEGFPVDITRPMANQGWRWLQLNAQTQGGEQLVPSAAAGVDVDDVVEEQRFEILRRADADRRHISRKRDAKKVWQSDVMSNRQQRPQLGRLQQRREGRIDNGIETVLDKLIVWPNQRPAEVKREALESIELEPFQAENEDTVKGKKMRATEVGSKLAQEAQKRPTIKRLNNDRQLMLGDLLKRLANNEQPGSWNGNQRGWASNNVRIWG